MTSRRTILMGALALAAAPAIPGMAEAAPAVIPRDSVADRAYALLAARYYDHGSMSHARPADDPALIDFLVANRLCESRYDPDGGLTYLRPTKLGCRIAAYTLACRIAPAAGELLAKAYYDYVPNRPTSPTRTFVEGLRLETLARIPDDLQKHITHFPRGKITLHPTGMDKPWAARFQIVDLIDQGMIRPVAWDAAKNHLTFEGTNRIFLYAPINAPPHIMA